MSATESKSPSPLPDAEGLAWVDHLASEAVAHVVGLVEQLELAFTYDPADLPNVLRPRVEFEPMTLERLGGFLLLSRDLARIGEEFREYAAKLGTAAESLYLAHEDTGGVVAGVAGVESYRRYRGWIAERF